MNINSIGPRGAQLMAKMLMHNHSLEELEMSYNIRKPIEVYLDLVL